MPAWLRVGFAYRILTAPVPLTGKTAKHSTDRDAPAMASAKVFRRPMLSTRKKLATFPGQRKHVCTSQDVSWNEVRRCTKSMPTCDRIDADWHGKDTVRHATSCWVGSYLADSRGLPAASPGTSGEARLHGASCTPETREANHTTLYVTQHNSPCGAPPVGLGIKIPPL